jgi:hypothetical protein
VAAKAKLKSCAAPLIEVLQNTKDEWIMRASFTAAAECGINNDERLEICVRRMRPRNNDWNMLILGLLKDGAIDSGGYGSQAIEDWRPILPAIQESWLEFIAAHRQLLRKGTKFPPSDPPLSREMFPPGFRIDRPGQPPWPEERN